MNTTTRVRRKIMVTLEYLDVTDEIFIARGIDLVVGKEYRLLAIDGYHGFAYIDAKGALDGYCVLMEQIGLENRG